MRPFYQFERVPQLIGTFLRGNIVILKPAAEDGWNETKEKVWSIAERCWKSDPESRPTAEELQKLVAGLNISDNRLPEPEYCRRKTNNKVDYGRVSDILDQVCEYVVSQWAVSDDRDVDSKISKCNSGF
jgi:hypothetical protein